MLHLSNYLFKGWNIGWDGDWFNNGDVFRFTEAYPDFDIKALSDYAISKGVRLIGHHETSGGISNYEVQLGDALDYYQKLGITSIKTGYVADGGDVKATDANGKKSHEWHDSQFMVRHYRRVVEEAAKRKIAINTHEPIKDTGLRRTLDARRGGNMAAASGGTSSAAMIACGARWVRPSFWPGERCPLWS